MTAMTALRQRMLDEMDLKQMPENTKRAYIRNVAEFAQFFGKSPEQLEREHIREYLLYLVRDKKVAGSTYRQVLASIRFLYRKTLGRDWVVEGIQHTRPASKLPEVLSMEEVDRFFDALALTPTRHVVGARARGIEDTSA